MNIQNIIKSLTDLYKGKEFVRLSKYGWRVHGTVDRIDALDTFIMDEESTKILISLKDKPTSDPDQERTQLKYTASRPKFQVISTNGIHYNFDECYFINETL